MIVRISASQIVSAEGLTRPSRLRQRPLGSFLFDSQIFKLRQPLFVDYACRWGQGGIHVFEMMIWAAAASALSDPAAGAGQANSADVTAGQPAAATVAVEAEPAAPLPASVKLPALTAVELKLLDEVTSKTAVSGMPVRLALARPLYVNGELGVPEGTAVEGVVIHAAKGGMGGKSGELLIGARLIRLGSEAIPLRSFKLGPAKGRNNETLAFATAVAVGLPALLINGGSARVEAGTIANAKTSADVEIPVALLSRLPPVPESLKSPEAAAPVSATHVNSNQGK
jgi:hypothetical protein